MYHECVWINEKTNEFRNENSSQNTPNIIEFFHLGKRSVGTFIVAPNFAHDIISKKKTWHPI